MMPCTTGASPTMSTTRMRGLSDAYGSWKIICIAAAVVAQLRGRRGPRAALLARSARRPTAAAGRRPGGRASTCRSRIRRPGRRPRPASMREIDTRSTACTTSSRRSGAEHVADLRREIERLDEALRHALQLDQRRARRQRRLDGAIGRIVVPSRVASASAHDAADQRMVAARGAATAGSPTSRIAGASLHATDRARRSARGTRSPAAGRAATASCPGICFSRAPRAIARRHRIEQPLRVRMRAAWSARRRSVPCSTMRPAYITQTRSARPATTDRSCVIQISAVPVSRVSFCIS